jgi:phage virion morphogenesis protein
MAGDVRIEDDGVRRALDKLRLSLPLGGSRMPAFRAIGAVLKSGAQMRFRTASGPDGKAWEKSFRAKHEGGQTLSLTRRLRNSITVDATNTQVAVGTNVVYAAIHQFGGVIRAKSGPFLAIPLTPVARSAGSPRNMTGLHVQQTIKGQFILANDKGAAQYLLRRQVRMPARPFLGASQSDRSAMQGVVAKYLQERWQ